MPRCDHCPLRNDPGDSCRLADDWPGWCGHLAKDANDPERGDFWAAKAREELGKPPAPKRVGRRVDPIFRANRESARGRVKVGFLCPCLQHGGAEAWQILLARSLDPARFVASGVVATHGANATNHDIRKAYLGVCPVGAGMEDARQLAEHSDVLITWAVDGLSAITDGLPSRPKVVSVCHAPVESEWGRTLYANPRGIDRWVGVSELARDAIPESSRVVPVDVIWNAVDVGRLQVRRSRSEMRGIWGVPDGAKVAGFYQRLTDEKDPMAAARLAMSLPDGWRVVAVGAGPWAIRIEEESGGKVILPGPDNASGDVLNAFDVLLVPSDYESFGLTLGEGLWAGVPVVSTDVGIAKIHPGLTYSIPFKADGPTLARAVMLAHASGPMPGSQSWARERLSPDRFAREWNDFLGTLCPDRPPIPAKNRLAAPSIDPIIRDAVLSCPDRGGVLPISQQDDCGCKGRELSECRANRGRTPGRVTLADCLDCRRRAAHRGTPADHPAVHHPSTVEPPVVT